MRRRRGKREIQLWRTHGDEDVQAAAAAAAAAVARFRSLLPCANSSDELRYLFLRMQVPQHEGQSTVAPSTYACDRFVAPRNCSVLSQPASRAQEGKGREGERETAGAGRVCAYVPTDLKTCREGRKVGKKWRVGR